MTLLPTDKSSVQDDSPESSSRKTSADRSKRRHSTIKSMSMVFRITKILSGRSVPSKKKTMQQQQQQHVASRSIRPAQISSLRLLCRNKKSSKARILERIRNVLGRQNETKKKSLAERRKSITWRRYARKSANDTKQSRPAGPQTQVKEDRMKDIHLSTESESNKGLVIFNNRARVYQPVPEDFLLHLLSLPSRITRKEQMLLLQQKVSHKWLQQARPPTPPPIIAPAPVPHKKVVKFDIESDEEEEDTGVEKSLEELCEEIVTQEHLDMLDSQANPFNFSERVSQSTRHKMKNTEVQTDPPPETSFAENAGMGNIYNAYKKDHDLKLLEEKLEKDQKMNSALGFAPKIADETPVVITQERKTPGSYNLESLQESAVILERMVVQNLYDDIIQDYMYWEDGGDEFHPSEGSLLPLWKFNCEASRSLVVSDICWSPVYCDLFAVSYTVGESSVGGVGGLLCLYTLKNPSTPERIFRCHCGVTCVHLHPRRPSLVVAGWADGTIAVYDVRSSEAPVTMYSTPVDGKHLLPVNRVRWIDKGALGDLSLYSVSMDGRLTHWRVTTSALLSCDVLDITAQRRRPRQPQMKGIGTCLALKPDDPSQLLLGVDTGSVYQFSIACPTHACTRYPAHTASVREVAWNYYHSEVFISCSLDWSVKIWLQFNLSPLMTLDLGGTVAGVQWAPYSSSVFVAVTDEGRVVVYDLFFRKSYPLCSQRLLQRRQVAVSCVALSPWHPVTLVGGERGYLLALKLSPNLRKIYSSPRGFQELPYKEIELCKIERLISLSRGLIRFPDCPGEEERTDDMSRERIGAALRLVVKKKHQTDF